MVNKNLTAIIVSIAMSQFSLAALANESRDNDKAICALLYIKSSVPPIDGVKLKGVSVKYSSSFEDYIFYNVSLVVDVMEMTATISRTCRVQGSVIDLP